MAIQLGGSDMSWEEQEPEPGFPLSSQVLWLLPTLLIQVQSSFFSPSLIQIQF